MNTDEIIKERLRQDRIDRCERRALFILIISAVLALIVNIL